MYTVDIDNFRMLAQYIVCDVADPYDLGVQLELHVRRYRVGGSAGVVLNHLECDERLLRSHIDIQ